MRSLHEHWLKQFIEQRNWRADIQPSIARILFKVRKNLHDEQLRNLLKILEGKEDLKKN